MTAEPVRKLSYLAWKDPDAWMEKMSGAKWDDMLAQEKRYLRELTDVEPTKSLIGEMREEMRAIEPVKHADLYTLADGAIHIQTHPGSKFTWQWSWADKKHWAYDIDVVGKTVWYITTEDEGAHYKNALICEDADCRIIWKKKAVAQQVAIRDGLCYYIKVEDYFTTVELCCCNAYTGANERILYKEKDKRRNLGITATAGKTMYLYSEDAGNRRTWRITRKGTLIPLDTDTEEQMMLGRWPDREHGEDQRLVRSKGSYDLVPRGDYIKSWHFPVGYPEHVNIMTGSVIVRNNEEQSLWFCGPGQRPRPLVRLPLARIDTNGWRIWEGDLVEEFSVVSPAEPIYRIRVLHGKIVETYRPFAAIPEKVALGGALTIVRGHARSADGTSVPFAIVSKGAVERSRGLIVYGYGAYGTPTNLGWPVTAWGPLLRRGWAVAYAFIRGGGDRGDKWANNARLTKRHHAVEDYEAVIRRAQTLTGLGPEKTVVYGRSAGGVIVGAVVARHPEGDLVGAAYAEVPYVDLLRTETNPDLPLTTGEYNEFGNPIERVADFAAMLAVSPVDLLTCAGAPGVFVLARTGLEDRQVFPYEPFKWIRRLRGAEAEEGPVGKYIAFEKDQAHVYQGPAAGEARAVDLAILESWIRRATASGRGAKNRTRKYKRIKMAKNNKMNKRNNKTQGGKRKHRSMKRRATRKHRKANKKNQ